MSIEENIDFIKQKINLLEDDLVYIEDIQDNIIDKYYNINKEAKNQLEFFSRIKECINFQISYYDDILNILKDFNPTIK